MLWTNFGWNWPSGSEDYFNVFKVALYLNELEFPLPKKCFVPIGWVVLEKKFFRVLMYVYDFVIISPWKRIWSFICTNLILFTWKFFVPCSFKIYTVVLEKKMKMWKVKRPFCNKYNHNCHDTLPKQNCGKQSLLALFVS